MIRRLVLFVFLFLGCQSAYVSAEELLCTDSDIEVQGTDLKDVHDGCEAVQSAAPFFELADLSMPRGVSIILVDGQHSSLVATHEMGNYDAKINSIRILAYQAAAKESKDAKSGLWRVASRDLWRSYIVHELTHAAIHLGCDKNCPSRAIHEYFAAVAQLSSLPKPVLEELLSHYLELEPFSQISEISYTYYAINPHFFAVKSYKHYQQLPDPRAFFRSVLHPAD